MRQRSMHPCHAALCFLLASALLHPLLCSAQNIPSPKKIAIFGSSVARGSGDHQEKGGYAGRLANLLSPRGWECVNVSKGGDNTISIVPRFESDLLPQHPRYVLIALSLSNEGIAKENNPAYRDAICEQWKSGIKSLIKRCRDAGCNVVIGNCYARNSFATDPALYDYTRHTNLQIGQWDVPSINFLGAIDNGDGAWVDHLQADAGHPNGSGHQEMFYAIVPSLFDALDAGKPTPLKASSNRFAFCPGGSNCPAPLLFAPQDTIHSFAISFWARTHNDGSLAAVQGKNALLQKETFGKNNPPAEAIFIEPGNTTQSCAIVCQNAQITYRNTLGAESKSAPLIKNQWQHILLSHACARGITHFYVDGILIDAIPERIIPERFFLGGDATPAKTAKTDLKEWAVYRSSLTPEEVALLHQGGLFQSSLEIYAPLDDPAFSAESPPKNHAQSMAQIQLTNNVLTAKTD